MREIVFLGLNNPSFLIRAIFHIGFLILTLIVFEGIDYAKVMRKTHYRQGILVHILLSIAVSYLVTKFFLTMIYSGYM